jgi:hypothetical protein
MVIITNLKSAELGFVRKLRAKLTNKIDPRSLFRGLSGPIMFAAPRFAAIFHANAHSRQLVHGRCGQTLERQREQNPRSSVSNAETLTTSQGLVPTYDYGDRMSL